MKKLQALILAGVLLISGISAKAITNTAIAASGTNIILSWPSYGYETYLIQSCQDLSSNTWTNLFNAFPANSTNLTTFTNYGVLTFAPCTNCASGGSTNSGPPMPGGTNYNSGGTNVYLSPVQTGF